MKNSIYLCCALVFLFLGCASVEKSPSEIVLNDATYNASAKKVWPKLIRVLQEEGISINTMDKESGYINAYRQQKFDERQGTDLLAEGVRYNVTISLAEVTGNKTKVMARCNKEYFSSGNWKPERGWKGEQLRGEACEGTIYKKLGESFK